MTCSFSYSDKKQWIQQLSLKLYCVAYVKQAVDFANRLETRIIIKILNRPYYPRKFDWFWWGWSKKQAQKGFRPLSAMSGIGYFQNQELFEELFWNFLDFSWIFFGGLGFFWEDLFGRISLGGFFGRIFWRIFLGRFFWEDVLRKYLFILLKSTNLFESEMDWCFCQDFVSIKKEGKRKEGQEFGSLEVPCKLIALKNGEIDWSYLCLVAHQ